MSNLISNAIRHTQPNEKIRVAVTETPDGVAITVENRGAGIPSDQIERVFDRYFRGDAARTQGSGSAGLGLAIVRTIMTLHGGTAKVASDSTGVTRFVLTFPKPAMSAPSSQSQAELPDTGLARVNPPRLRGCGRTLQHSQPTALAQPAVSIRVTVYALSRFSTAKRILSTAFTRSSRSGSLTWNTIVIGGISRLAIGPWRMVIFFVSLSTLRTSPSVNVAFATAAVLSAAV